MGTRVESKPVKPIKLGAQYMVSCYFAPDDYWALREWSEANLGNRKMASVVRSALHDYLTKRGVSFAGLDPRLIEFEES
jgi:hypothetical protein